MLKSKEVLLQNPWTTLLQHSVLSTLDARAAGGGSAHTYLNICFPATTDGVWMLNAPTLRHSQFLGLRVGT